MKKVFSFTSVILLFLYMTTPSIAQKMTLDEAINLALKNNEKIKQYDERVIQKDYENKTAFGNFLPSVKFEGSVNHMNDPLSLSLDPIRQAIMQMQSSDVVNLQNLSSLITNHVALTPAQQQAVYSQAYSSLNAALPPFEETFKKQDYWSATLIGVQPIFMGGKILAGKKYAASEFQSSEAELRKTQNEVTQETINNFLNVILVKELVKTRKDVLSGIQKHKDDAEKLAAAGLIAPYNLLRAKVAVADAERNLFDDENKLELAYIAFKHTLNLPENTPVTIEDGLNFKTIKDSIYIYQAEAQLSQPIFDILKNKKIAAEQKYNVQVAEFMPQLAAYGKYEVVQKYLSSLEPQWAVGLQLNFSLFEGAKKYNQLESAVHLEKEIEHLEAYTKEQIDLWINKSYRDMRNAEKKYEMLASSIDLAKESLRQNEKRFSTGLGTSLEVIDARLSLEKNEVDQLVALYDYYKSYTDLLVASGNTKKFINTWNKEN
jgi:outer membrane protein TolC